MRGTFAFFMLLSSCFLCAQENLSLSVETGGGILFGETHEYVISESGKVLSRLDWQENWIPSIAIIPRFNFFNFFIAAKFLCAMPLDSAGNAIEDYDFLIEGSDAASLYSRHDAYLDKQYDISGQLGYVVKLRQWEAALGAGFQYRTRKWSAVDGYLQYPEDDRPWTGDEPQKTVAGTSITYEQIIWMPLLSAEFKYHLKDWTFGASGAFFPYVRADSLDTHFLRQVQFYDKMSGGIGGACTVFVTYTNAKLNYLSFGLSGGIDLIRNTTGETSAGKIGAVENEMKKSSGGSKFESENWHVEFTVKLGR
jgi:outer membrane protease